MLFRSVGNSMFNDLVSVAGHLYKFGVSDGLPGCEPIHQKIPIHLYADEFSDLVGTEFIPMVNKSGGAGIEITALSQTLSDIESRLGNRARAGQVIGNFNSLIMLRVRETATAELLTRQLPKVEMYATSVASGATDSSDPHGNTAFTSSTRDQITTATVPLIEPAHVVALPKGQAFALIEGGRLWKIRIPLPKPDPEEVMPADLQALASHMRQRYGDPAEWWQSPASPVADDLPTQPDLMSSANVKTSASDRLGPVLDRKSVV